MEKQQPEIKNPLIEKWENKLYDLMETTENHLLELNKKAADLYSEIEKGRQGRPNLHQQTLLNQKEGDYWKLQGEISATKEDKRLLEEVTALLEEGKISEDELESKIKKFIPKTITIDKALSKRRAAMERDEKYLREHGHNFDEEVFDEHFGPYRGSPTGSNPNHLTTGRHASGVKYNRQIDLETAEAEFFYRTADTHGGKVGHGKKRYKDQKRGGTSSVQKREYKKK